MIAWDVIHRNGFIQREDALEPAVVCFVPVHGISKNPHVNRLCKYVLDVRHLVSAIVHHVSQENHHVRIEPLRSPPALPHIEVHNALAYPHKPCWPIRVRPVVEHLRVRYEQNVRGSVPSCL